MPAKIVRQYYLLVVLLYGGVNATAAMYTIFLLRKGLAMPDVYLVRLAYFVTLFFCEFFTGVLADWLGRKTLVLASCVLFFPSMLIYASSESFWWFVGAEILGAFAQSCANGACEAWFVDRVRHYNGNNGDDKFNSRFSRSWMLKHFSALVAGVIGARLADVDMVYTWIFASSFFVVGFAFALIGMREEYFVKTALTPYEAWSDLKLRVRKGLEYGWKNTNLRFITAAVFGLYFAVMAPNLLWQPYFAQWSPDHQTQGFIWAGMSVSLMFGALLAPQVVNGFACERRALLICGAIIAGGIVGTVSFGFPAALAAFFIYQAARGAFGAIKDPYLHHSIKGNEQRAALSSLESAAYHGGGAVGLVTWGVFLRDVPMQTAWMVSGLTLLAFLLVLSVATKQREATRKMLKPSQVGIILAAILFAIGILMPSNRPASLDEAMRMQSPPPPVGASVFEKNP